VNDTEHVRPASLARLSEARAKLVRRGGGDVAKMRSPELVRGRSPPRWQSELVAFAGDDYVETFIVSSWAEHLRQHERVTNADRAVEDRLRTYVTGVPTVRHFVSALART